MEIAMIRLAASVMIAGVLLSPAPAGAQLTAVPGVTVFNPCNRTMKVAIRYRTTYNAWKVDGFSRIPPHGSEERVASTRDGIVYVYVEGAQKHLLSQAHSEPVEIEGKTYVMARMELKTKGKTGDYEYTLPC
jgi:hypothetical protein